MRGFALFECRRRFRLVSVGALLAGLLLVPVHSVPAAIPDVRGSLFDDSCIAPLDAAPLIAAGSVSYRGYGDPVEGARIRLVRIDGSGVHEAGLAISNADGYFEIPDTAGYGPGDYAATCEFESYPDFTDRFSWAGSGPHALRYSIYRVDPARYIPVAGDDRYRTAVEGSRLAFPAHGACESVLIASGVNFPDALGASALAGALECPVLLTDPHAISASVVQEIDRLGATTAYIVGGASAVSRGVEDTLEASGLKCIRIAGGDRYETAARVALKAQELLKDDLSGEVLIATGEDFPDALAAAPIAAWAGTPILLVRQDSIPAPALAALDALDPEKVVMLGGLGAIGLKPTEALQERFGSSLERIEGDDRYGTARGIAIYGTTSCGLHYENAGFATGEDFPDALAGGAVQGLRRSIMLLTEGEALSRPTSAAIKYHGDQMFEVGFYGGTNAVSQTVRSQITRLIDAEHDGLPSGF